MLEQEGQERQQRLAGIMTLEKRQKLKVAILAMIRNREEITVEKLREIDL